MSLSRRSWRVARRVVGCFWQAAARRRPGETVFGAGVAARDFVAALLQHATVDRCVLVVPPRDRAACARDLRRGTHAGPARVCIPSDHSLPPRLASEQITAWHDIRGDIRRPFRVRRLSENAAARSWPVTITHHAVSYPGLLHDWFLALLLADARSYDAIVCTSRAACTAIGRLLDHVADGLARSHGVRTSFAGRLETIPLGVDIDRFRPREKAPLRARWGLDPRDLVVLWLGRVSMADKADLLPLIGVFRDLVRPNGRRHATRSRVRLVIAGTDRRYDLELVRDYARRLGVASRVTIVPDVDPGRRHLLLPAADIFVSPADNIQETFGLAPLEAMASGVPQVVADWDGYRDIVADGVTGYLVPTLWARCDDDPAVAIPAHLGDDEMVDHLALAQSVAVEPTVLRERLAVLIDREDVRARMAANSRARAVGCFAWRGVIAAYEALWDELAAEAAVARRPRAVPRDAYAWPSPFDAFRGYATASLVDATPIGITPAGRRVLAGREPLVAYLEPTGLFDADLLEAALRTLARAQRRTVTPTLGRLERALETDTARARRHILWLIKYGFAGRRR